MPSSNNEFRLEEPGPAERALADRRLRRISLTEWAADALRPQGIAPAVHHRLLLARLEELSRGEIDRLMVLMPPGSAKSTYASVIFPAWWFTQHPASSVIAASHTADLAEHFGRQVRNMIVEQASLVGYRLVADNRAAARWETTERGQYFATGVRGPITGRRADLAIIDDPIKSHADADSIDARDQLWTWYRSILLTRLRPKARIVLVMNRWHEDDLAGRLLAAQAAEWTCLCLPALAEPGDPLGRALGAPLWPEWEDLADLTRKREGVGERDWAGMFQQRPNALQGSLFKTRAIRPVTPPLAPAAIVVRAWDLAATAMDGRNDPDWTVGLKLARDEAGRCTVLDVVRLRGSPREIEDAILRTAKADGLSVIVGLPQDPGQAGKTQVAYLTAALAGHRVISSRETGSKFLRANPVASQVEAGNLAVLTATWNHAFLRELAEFPSGRKDDQVDALSRAFAMVTDSKPPMRRLHVPMMSR